MSLGELRALLDQVADTRELVLRRETASGSAWSEAYAAWSDAREEAADAYRSWRRDGGPEAYAIFRAAQDREDAAQDALVAFTPAAAA
jgi:hypothetical protein